MNESLPIFLRLYVAIICSFFIPWSINKPIVWCSEHHSELFMRYLCNTEVATWCTANLEALGPVKHDLYESLMAWDRAPAKRINELFSAEWEALIFGHSQGDKVRHQARSLKLESV